MDKRRYKWALAHIDKAMTSLSIVAIIIDKMQKSDPVKSVLVKKKKSKKKNKKK